MAQPTLLLGEGFEKGVIHGSIDSEAMDAHTGVRRTQPDHLSFVADLPVGDEDDRGGAIFRQRVVFDQAENVAQGGEQLSAPTDVPLGQLSDRRVAQ